MINTSAAPIVLLLICDAFFLPSYCLQHIQKAVDGAASAEGITKVDNELSALKHQVAGELIGARYVVRVCFVYGMPLLGLHWKFLSISCMKFISIVHAALCAAFIL